MICQVRSCCCGIPLRESVFILGYLRLFLGVMIFILSSASLSVFNAYLRNSWDGTASVASIAAMAEGIYLIATSLLLIVGGHKRTSMPIRAFYWIALIGLLMEIFNIAVLTFADQQPLTLLSIPLPLCLEVYFVIVIRSSYLEIDIEQENLIQNEHDVENPLTRFIPARTTFGPTPTTFGPTPTTFGPAPTTFGPAPTTFGPTAHNGIYMPAHAVHANNIQN